MATPMRALPGLFSLVLLLAGCTALPAPLPALEDVLPAPPPPQPAAPPPARGTLRVHVVDVGQGDGTVWELPDGSLVLYDCGPPGRAGAEAPILRFLRDLGHPAGARIAALVVSHGHLDHAGGCQDVLRDHLVAHIYDTWYRGDDAPAAYQRFQDAARAEGAVLHVLGDDPELETDVPFKRGTYLALTDQAAEAGVRAEVLWPDRFVGRGWDAIEASSLALRLSFGDLDLCVQGDLGRAEERALAQAFQGKDCEAYLVGHHGSAGASSAEWLAAMDPEVAVVSFGTNDYGHPTSAALCRVQQAGAQVYATHRLGSITLSLDPSGVLTVHPNRPETEAYCTPGADYWRS